MKQLYFLCSMLTGLVLTLPVLAQTTGVGIGTTSPTQTLDVNGGLLVRSYLPVSNQGAYLQWNRSRGDGETWLLNQRGGGTANAGIRFGSVTTGDAVTEYARFLNNGYFGIGTSTPTSPLTVKADGNNTNLPLLSFTTSAGADKYNFSLAGGGLNLSESNVASGRLFVKDGGNVGIGTTSPSQKLDVNGNSNVSGNTTVGGTSTVSGNSYVAGSLGLGTTAPAPSAALDVTSTTQGLLLPRLTSAQMYSIAAPAAGLLVYNTDANGFYGFKGPAATSTIDQSTQDYSSRPSSNYGQSFTAAATTNLTSILIYNVSGSGNSALVLTIYTGGNGPGGTVLYTATQPFSGAGAITFLLPGISVSSGQVYSFLIKRADNSNISVAASTTDTYSGGTIFYRLTNATVYWDEDMAFKLTFNTGTWQAL